MQKNDHRKIISICFYGEDHRLYHRLKEEARQRDRSVSSFFREVARDYLNRNGLN